MSDPTEEALTIEALVARVKARGKSTGLVASVYTAVYLAAIELGFEIAVDGTVRVMEDMTREQHDELSVDQFAALMRARMAQPAWSGAPHVQPPNLDRPSRLPREDHQQAVYAAAIAWRRTMNLLSAPESPTHKLNAVIDEAIAFEDHAHDGGPYR